AETARDASETRAEGLARELSESRGQQAATGEILRLVHRAPADTGPVFGGLLASALRLARADYGAGTSVGGDLLNLPHAYGQTREWRHVAQSIYPFRIDTTSASGQAIMGRRAVFVEDAQNSPIDRVRNLARTMGYRCQLMIPMLRQETVLGVLALVWQDAHDLPPDPLAFLATFPHPAPI